MGLQNARHAQHLRRNYPASPRSVFPHPIPPHPIPLTFAQTNPHIKDMLKQVASLLEFLLGALEETHGCWIPEIGARE
ncbi:hypothetical protein BELL_0236g00120 [Botrytis elliptica]|uniref:Uncharacterized protein n=1 Tax=Botrytis elliptica TaxID=278938 RepID=A0A4Z1K111_9HELO|nr:hypothetical protein BELL_0236g00120 [Botrytis elliptica]